MMALVPAYAALCVGLAVAGYAGAAALMAGIYATALVLTLGIAARSER